MPDTPPPVPDEVMLVSERIARISDRYRSFTESAERAQRLYRIPLDLLTHLLDQGLPCRREGSGYLFDGNDLKSVAMALPTRSPQRHALKALADALAAGVEPVVERTVNLQAHCPSPGHEGLCAYELAPEIRQNPDAVRLLDLGPQHFEIAVRVAGGDRTDLVLTDSERQLVTEVADLRFHRIPMVLNLDLGFLAETGLADCRLATRFLFQRGQELGVQVRECTGLFLSRPFSPRHYWVELRRDDRWVCADPFFLTALARWGLLDPGIWPPTRSPMGAFWKVDIYPDAALVTHCGGSPVSIMTN